MGAVTWSIPARLALVIAEQCGARAFVETGTYKGVTALWAAANFDHVWTVEGDPKRFNVLDTLANPKITTRLGDSPAELPGMLAEAGAPALIWLDAHWTGHAEHPPVNGIECPVVEEIKAVNASAHAAEHAIMIDDANFFTTPGRIVNYRDWPTLDVIMRELLAADRYVFIKDDVICAVPGALRDSVRDRVVKHA